jgi:hypothetical protein
VDAKDDLNGWLMHAIRCYKKDWVYFGNNWEVRASDVPAMMQKCSKLFADVRDEWMITVATTRTQIAQCRRDLRARQKAAEETQEEEDNGEDEILSWNLIAPDMDLGSCIARIRGDVKLGWRIFGEGWEIDSSNADEMAKTCRMLFRDIPRKKWEITICKTQMRAFMYRRDHNVKESPSEKSREEDQSRGTCAGVSGSSCTDTLAAGSDCTPTQLGQLPAQNDLGPRVGESSSVGSSARSGGTSDGKITDDPKQAETGLVEDTSSGQQLRINSVEDQGLVNQDRLTCQDDGGRSDVPSRTSDPAILGVQLRSVTAERATENPRLEGVCSEPCPIHITGCVREGTLGQADENHNRAGKSEESSPERRLEVDTTDDAGREVNPDITLHGGSSRVDDPDRTCGKSLPPFGFRENTRRAQERQGDGGLGVAGPIESGTVATHPRVETSSGNQTGASVERDLSHEAAKSTPQSAPNQKVKKNQLTSMKDANTLVRIWLGTKDIPSDTIWVKKVLTPESLIFHVKMRFGVNMEHTWFDGGELRLKGGEEFIIDTEKGCLYKESKSLETPAPDLSKSYLKTWETSENLDPLDEQAELASEAGALRDEEYRRHAINGSDGYWNDTVRIPSSNPMQDLLKIWREVKQRLIVPNSLFALVKEQEYLPRQGWLSEPIQEVEVKLRGESKKQLEQSAKKEFLRDPKFPTSFRLRHGNPVPEIWQPSTVAEIREVATEEGWFKGEIIQTGEIEVGPQVNGQWVKLNDCQLIQGGEVVARQPMPALVHQTIT